MSLLQGILSRLYSMKEKGEDQERFLNKMGLKSVKYPTMRKPIPLN